MKKILFAMAAFVCSLCANAQDLLVKTNGDILKVKVIEFAVKEVKYKQYDNLDGPTYSISNSEVTSVQLENGTIHKPSAASKTSGALAVSGDGYSSSRSGLGSYDSEAQCYGRGVDHALSLYLQDGWGIGYDVRFNFNKYIALDIAGINFYSGFASPEEWCQLNIRFGGVRGYTPNWKMIRGYANFDLGYTMIHSDGYYGSGETHHFGFDFGVGVQVYKSITVGYNLNCIAMEGGVGKSHWARIGFVF